MSTWRGQTDAKTINYEDDDDDWDTEADFVNDVSEKEQRWGSKTIEGSLNADKDVSVREVREGVVTTHEKKVKEDYQKGPMGSAGYGGKFGVQNDRMDKSAGSWAHNEEVSKHSSVTDSSKGFGGKFGVQKDRQDKTSVGYDHQTELSKHNSQTDGAKGFGGKFGVQQGSQDKNAVGYDHQTELSKHNSQTDGAKGFGGKFGVDKTKQDKSAQGYSDGGGPVSGTGYKTAIDVKGDVKNFRSRFENFGAGQEEETRKKLEAEREKRRQDDEKRKADEKKREDERDRQFASENKEKADKQAESKRREEEIAEEKRVKAENSVVERKRAEEETRLKGVEAEKKRVRDLKEQAEQQNRQDDERQKQEGERKRQEQEDARRKQEEEDDRKRGEEEKVRRKESEREAEKRQKEDDARVEQERQRADDQSRAEDQKREEEKLVEAERMRQEEELAKQTAALSVSMSGKTATAVFDYTAGPDGDEVSFSQGDIISNVEQPDEGWWVGEVGGKKGMFPASYVTLNEDAVAVEPVKPKRQSSNLGPSDEGLCGVALYSYTAADTDELTFDEGEKITNVEKPDEGWWLGVCRGRKGIFPASYITISGSASAPPNLGQCGKAIYSYDAADVDELTLVEGVKVTNIEMIDEGWWMGQCNGGKGIFPASYVQLED